MKVQLILTPVTDESEKVDKGTMPIGLLCLANAVDDICDVEILDGNHLTNNQILNRLGADITGIAYTALSAPNVREIAREAKAKGSYVIFGGQAATADPESLFKLPETDLVVVHDGEKSLRMLIQNGLKNLDRIPNLFYRDNAQIRQTHLEMIDLNEYSRIDRSVGGLDVTKYASIFSQTNTLLNIPASRPTNIVSQRGCMRKCSFCARQDKNFRTRKPEDVLDEIKSLKALGIDYILDYSDTWAFNQQWIEAFHAGNDSDLGMMVFADIRDITPQKLKLMRECGIDNILYGVESGCETILKRNGKAYNKKRIVDVIKQTTAAGIKVSASFVIGLLGENQATLAETENLVDELHEMRCVRPYLNVIIPLPGSRLWQEFLMQPEMREKYEHVGLEYALERIRNDYLRVCTKVTLQELTELRDRLNQYSGLKQRAYEYAR